MYLRVLKTEEDLLHYSKLTHRYIDVLFPLEYLERSRVIGCIDDRGRICGGFVVVLKGPFRVLEQIPDGCDPLQSFNTNKAAEITGLWRSNSWWQSKGSATLFLRLAYEILRSKKRYFLYSYSLRKPSLGKLYSFVHPKVLYRGYTFLPGMDKADTESVEFFSIWNFIGAIFRSPSFLASRIGPAGLNIRKRVFAVLTKRISFP